MGEGQYSSKLYRSGVFCTPLTEAGLFSDPKKVKFLDQRIPMKRGAPPFY